MDLALPQCRGGRLRHYWVKGEWAPRAAIANAAHRAGGRDGYHALVSAEKERRRYPRGHRSEALRHVAGIPRLVCDYYYTVFSVLIVWMESDMR